jgi:hypothetical protein
MNEPNSVSVKPAAGQPGDIHEVACWAHVRRKLHDVYIADSKSFAAQSALRAIQELYEIERQIAHDPPDDRREVRKASQLKIRIFFVTAEATLAKISARTPLALALRYALNRREALLRYTGDGRLEIDNNRAENAIRGIAIGRKNSYDHCQRFTRDKTDRPAQDSLGWHRNRQRTRRSGFLDGRSNSCPGIGCPMMTVRRKASSFWLRT